MAEIKPRLSDSPKKSSQKTSKGRGKKSSKVSVTDEDDADETDGEEAEELLTRSSQSRAGRKLLARSSPVANDTSSDELAADTSSSSHAEKPSVRKSGRLKKGSHSRKFSPEIEIPSTRKKRGKRKIESEEEDLEEDEEEESTKRRKYGRSRQSKRQARSMRSKRKNYAENDDSDAGENNNKDDDDGEEEVAIDTDEADDGVSETEDEEAVSTSTEVDDDSEDEIISKNNIIKENSRSQKHSARSLKSKAHNGHSRVGGRKRQLLNSSDINDGNTDNEDAEEISNGKRVRLSRASSLKRAASLSSAANKHSSMSRTRNRGKQKVTYMEYSDEEDSWRDDSSSFNLEDEDASASKSVSCRGRLRKMTPRARASLKGY